MAPTYTSRLGLRKPAVGDYYDVADANFNADTVDAHIQVTVCTSGTRPGSPWNGQMIYETDTERFYVWSTGVASWRQLLVGLRPAVIAVANSTTALFKGELVNSATLAGNRLLDGRLVGAANPGYYVNFDGQQWWGAGGGSTVDTNLYRDSAGILATDHALQAKATSMVTQQVYDTNNRTTTSTTFTDTLATGSALAISIPAPPSGKLDIAIACRSYPSVAGNVCQTSARISGGGTQVSAYEKCFSVSDVTTDRRGITFTATGLTPGVSTVVTMQHSVSAGTGNFDFRSLRVTPCLG